MHILKLITAAVSARCDRYYRQGLARELINGWASGDTLGLLQQLGAAPKFA
jgi:hypothetical protein